MTMPALRIRFLLLASLLAGLPGLAGATAARPSPTLLCQAAIAQVEREAGLPPRLLAAIARVESGRRDPESGATGPWPWTINAEGRGSFFPDRTAAIAAVRTLQAQGVRSIDVGCMQVNLRHHPNAFASLEEAFDPLSNARYAARFLGELQATRGDWMRTAAHYHSQAPELAEAYRARVAAAWEAERSAPAPVGYAQALRAHGGFNGSSGGGALLEIPLARSAALLPLAGGGGGAGRGLDAYRAQPIPVAGRAGLALPAIAQMAAPARPAGPSLGAAPRDMPTLASPTLALPAPAPPMAGVPAMAPAPPLGALFGAPRPAGGLFTPAARRS